MLIPPIIYSESLHPTPIAEPRRNSIIARECKFGAERRSKKVARTEERKAATNLNGMVRLVQR